MRECAWARGREGAWARGRVGARAGGREGGSYHLVGRGAPASHIRFNLSVIVFYAENGAEPPASRIRVNLKLS